MVGMIRKKNDNRIEAFILYMFQTNAKYIHLQ